MTDNTTPAPTEEQAAAPAYPRGQTPHMVHLDDAGYVATPGAPGAPIIHETMEIHKETAHLAPTQPTEVVDCADGGQQMTVFTPGMKPTQNIPEGLDLKNPVNIAKVSLMPNETHPDLLGDIRKLLVTTGRSAEQLAHYDNHFLIAGARGASLLAQRVALVSYWNAVFSTVGEKGYQARQMLTVINSTTITKDILEWFGKYPLDLIAVEDLPRMTATA